MAHKEKAFQLWLSRMKFIDGEYPFGPIAFKRNEEGRLHSETGPSYISPTRCTWYIDGRKHGLDVDIYGSMCYFYEDILVPRHYIEKPESLTPEEVFNHPNTEVKYVGVKIYGYDKLLNESNHSVNIIHEDPETDALLFELRGIFDQPFRIVRVFNSTPELDGTYKQYFLNVPPTVTTCKEAVAWTFRMEEDEYQPSQQT